MKKTVIIAILLIYLGSIVAVNFFGLKVKNFEGTKYVEHITWEAALTDDDRKEEKIIRNVNQSTGVENFIFQFKEGAYSPDDLTDNPNSVLLIPHVYPENADNKRVKLEYDKDAAEQCCVVKEDISTIIFFAPGALTIDIVAADGSNVKTTVYVWATTREIK